MATAEVRVFVELGPESMAQLARIERLQRALANRLEIDMSELDDKLTAEETALTALEADEQRELADLQALQAAGQTLTPEQESRLDALASRIAADDAAIQAADPAPAAPEAAPAE